VAKEGAMNTRAVLVSIVLIALVSSPAETSSIAEIMNYHSLGEVQIASQGKGVVFVVTTPNLDSNVLDSNLWYLDPSTGDNYPLTQAPKRDWHPRWSPDGQRVAFLSDRGEKTNIWLMTPGKGEGRQVTDIEGGMQSFAWLPDGSGFVFSMTDPKTEEEERREEDQDDPILVDKNFKYARLYRIALNEDEPELLTKDDYHINSFDVAPNGEHVVFSRQPTPKVPDGRLYSDLSLLDMKTGVIRDLVSHPGLDIDPSFSPDGSWVAFVSMAGKADWIGNYYVYIVGRDGSGLRNLSQSFDERVGGKPVWSRDASHIYFMGNEHGDGRIWSLEVASGQVEPAGAFDRGQTVNAFDLAEDDGLVFSASAPNSPAEIFQASLGATEAGKLTNINVAYKGSKFGKTELVTYESHDGLELEGYLVKPVGYQEGRRYPLLVIVHGGPSGVFSSAFSPRRGAYPVHAFSEEGYLVFMPNPRGSGGYGEEFRRSNFKDWGYGDYQDIMTGVDVLIERGLADSERMGVMGWSYGGFMTSMIVTKTSRFKAASVGAGVTNPYSFYETTDIPEFMEAYFGGKPWEPETDYLRHAAVHHAGNAKTPTLIQHGKEDVRVPLPQGEAFYRALKKVGVEVEMVIYPRTPHGLREPKLIRDALERNLQWFAKWVKSDS
jgi:dipeptidyl aminopeptidase/acylaminoacyl peptidase